MKQFISRVLGYSGKSESRESTTLIPQNQGSHCTVTYRNRDAPSVETCAIHTSAGSCAELADITDSSHIADEATSGKISSFLSKVNVIVDAVNSVFSMPTRYDEDDDGVGHPMDHGLRERVSTGKKYVQVSR